MMSAATRTTYGMATRQAPRSMATAAAADAPQGPPRTRDGYGFFLDIPTRWKDNDQFGHINNGESRGRSGIVPRPHTHMRHDVTTARCSVSRDVQ